MIACRVSRHPTFASRPYGRRHAAGATPRDEAKMMTPEEVARIVARGIQKRKRLCLMENEGRATHFVKKFAPGFLDRMFYLVMSREPDSLLK